MSAHRFFAMVLIFAAACGGWMILGQTLEFRTATLGDSLSAQVETLWGPPNVVQAAPTVTTADPAQAQLLASDVHARFDHANRYKGLLWFSTYTVKFNATYTVQVNMNEKLPGHTAAFTFDPPANVRRLDDLQLTVNGAAVEPDRDRTGRGAITVTLAPAEKPYTVAVSYSTYGRDRWSYSPSPTEGGPGDLIRDLTVTLATNFTDIDYPADSVSPTSPARPEGDGMVAQWKYSNTRSRMQIGLEMPKRPNAGPVAARMSFFAPVSLLFFFTAIFTVVVLKKISLHPMHYLFIAAGFFAFHILLSYLVDIVNIHAAFWICAAVSVFLVVSYMRLVAGLRFAATVVAAAQLVYLVGFSYAFFWPGKTGLAVTIGAIVTLFVLMQATGKVNWHAVFAATAPQRPTTPPPLPE